MKNKITLLASKKNKSRIITYNFSNSKMTFCTAPDKKGRIECTNYFDSCRETVSSFLRCQIEGTSEEKSEIKLPQIDLKRARLLFYMKADSDCNKDSTEEFAKRRYNNMAVGLKVVNHFEKKYGWLLTKMSKIDTSKFKIKDGHGSNVADKINIYMFVGSNKWIKSPHVLSLYMLLLRLGIRGFDGNFNTHEEFLEGVKAFAHAKKEGSNDSAHILKTSHMWDVLLKNHGKLFKDKTIVRLYSGKHLINGYSGFNEGIYKLCNGLSNDYTISQRFISLCKDCGIPLEYKVKLKKKDEDDRVVSTTP